jgi:hypothetical protein
MEVELLQVKPGQIISEYATTDPEHMYTSYLVVRTRGFTNQQFQCLCIFNGARDVKDKPGDTSLINKDWLVSLDVAKHKRWNTYWRVQNGH